MRTAFGSGLQGHRRARVAQLTEPESLQTGGDERRVESNKERGHV
jgi:hypothetical protein